MTPGMRYLTVDEIKKRSMEERREIARRMWGVRDDPSLERSRGE